MSIDKMAQNFKEAAEYQAYIETQHKIITELSKKINTLEERNKHLEKTLQGSSPLTGEGGQFANVKMTEENSFMLTNMNISPARMTIELELAKLHKIAEDRELELDEIKKLDILVKNQVILKEQEKSKPEELDLSSNEDLLKFLNESTATTKQ